jgi:hypothetical protein
MQKVAVGGESTRIMKRKVLGHMRVLGEAGTSGYIKMGQCTDMGYTDGRTEMYIMGNGNRINKMVKGIKGRGMAINIPENGRIISRGERESKKRRENYSKMSMKMAS